MLGNVLQSFRPLSRISNGPTSSKLRMVFSASEREAEEGEVMKSVPLTSWIVRIDTRAEAPECMKIRWKFHLVEARQSFLTVQLR